MRPSANGTPRPGRADRIHFHRTHISWDLGISSLMFPNESKTSIPGHTDKIHFRRNHIPGFGGLQGGKHFRMCTVGVSSDPPMAQLGPTPQMLPTGSGKLMSNRDDESGARCSFQICPVCKHVVLVRTAIVCSYRCKVNRCR